MGSLLSCNKGRRGVWGPGIKRYVPCVAAILRISSDKTYQYVRVWSRNGDNLAKNKKQALKMAHEYFSLPIRDQSFGRHVFQIDPTAPIKIFFQKTLCPVTTSYWFNLLGGSHWGCTIRGTVPLCCPMSTIRFTQHMGNKIDFPCIESEQNISHSAKRRTLYESNKLTEQSNKVCANAQF